MLEKIIDKRIAPLSVIAAMRLVIELNCQLHSRSCDVADHEVNVFCLNTVEVRLIALCFLSHEDEIGQPYLRKDRHSRRGSLQKRRKESPLGDREQIAASAVREGTSLLPGLFVSLCWHRESVANRYPPYNFRMDFVAT